MLQILTPIRTTPNEPNINLRVPLPLRCESGFPSGLQSQFQFRAAPSARIIPNTSVAKNQWAFKNSAACSICDYSSRFPDANSPMLMSSTPYPAAGEAVSGTGGTEVRGNNQFFLLRQSGSVLVLEAVARSSCRTISL